MIYEYDELKEYIQEDFDRFYGWEFNEKQILPAILDDYRHGAHFTQVENICIHIFIIYLYLQNELNPKIVMEELKKLMLTQDQQNIRAELGDDYKKFVKDFHTIKSNSIYDKLKTSIPNDDMHETGGIRRKNNINKIIAFTSKHKKIIQFFLLIAIIVLFIWYQNNHLVTTMYAYKSNKISGDANKFCIAQISDLHNAGFGKNNKKLINNIEGLKPDIVVITGDIVDANHTDISTAINFVREIAGKYPVYYVTGNHEYWLDEAGRKELFAGIRDAGAVILDNENVSITMDTGRLNLIGLDDESLHDATLRSILEKCNENEVTVVLAHEPQYIEEYSDAGADLVLTGHAHGGQMILPLIGPLIAPDQGFFPKYTDGQFERKNTTMYVSRGLGNSVIPVRLFNYPEIVCIEIEGTG